MTSAADEPAHEPLLDEAAGRLVRPYAISNGRTRPTNPLDLMTLVMDTGQVPALRLGPEHGHALSMCKGPTAIAEIAAQMRLPVMVAKILVSDLIDCGAVTTRAPWHADDPLDTSVLEAVLDGLRRRL